MKKKIAIVGCGWNGAHLALLLAKQGYEVTVFEAAADIFKKNSGTFGLRNHMGMHYPRSDITRQECLKTYDEFAATYPELMNDHPHSIYGLGVEGSDAQGKSPQVSAEYFTSLAAEDPHRRRVMQNPAEFGHDKLKVALDMPEKTIAVGRKLRTYFKDRLKKANVEVKVNTRVDSIQRNAAGKMVVSANGEEHEFDQVINATAYNMTSTNEKPLFGMQMVYQAFLGFAYEDTQEKQKGKVVPLIVMDGMYPCLMYYNDGEPKENSHYLLYHAKYTPLASCATAKEAEERLAEMLRNPELLNELERLSREHFEKFYPGFSQRFKLIGHKEGVIGKIKTSKEFRSAITFQDKAGIIHVIAGKVQQCITIGKEVLKLIQPEAYPDEIISEEGYRYIRGSVLESGKKEIVEVPSIENGDDLSRNTCYLQTGAQIEASLKKTKTLSSVFDASFVSPPTSIDTADTTYVGAPAAGDGVLKRNKPFSNGSEFFSSTTHSITTDTTDSADTTCLGVSFDGDEEDYEISLIDIDTLLPVSKKGGPSPLSKEYWKEEEQAEGAEEEKEAKAEEQAERVEEAKEAKAEETPVYKTESLSPSWKPVSTKTPFTLRRSLDELRSSIFPNEDDYNNKMQNKEVVIRRHPDPEQDQDQDGKKKHLLSCVSDTMVMKSTLASSFFEENRKQQKREDLQKHEKRKVPRKHRKKESFQKGSSIMDFFTGKPKSKTPPDLLSEVSPLALPFAAHSTPR